jgi:ABC-type maltose transport system permease subunit
MMEYLTYAMIPLILEVILCYECFVEYTLLTKYWVLVLIAHAILCCMVIIFWIYDEYYTVVRVTARNSSHHAAVLQAATRRKLSLREITLTRGISKPLRRVKRTKSAGFKRVSVIYEDNEAC